MNNATILIGVQFMKFMKVTIIEEFTNEKKFGKKVEDYMNEDITAKYTVAYAITMSPKGFLYSALIIKS